MEFPKGRNCEDCNQNIKIVSKNFTHGLKVLELPVRPVCLTQHKIPEHDWIGMDVAL